MKLSVESFWESYRSLPTNLNLESTNLISKLRICGSFEKIYHNRPLLEVCNCTLQVSYFSTLLL